MKVRCLAVRQSFSKDNKNVVFPFFFMLEDSAQAILAENRFVNLANVQRT